MTRDYVDLSSLKLKLERIHESFKLNVRQEYHPQSWHNPPVILSALKDGRAKRRGFPACSEIVVAKLFMTSDAQSLEYRNSLE